MQMIASHLDNNSMLLVRKTAKAVFNVASGRRWPGASQAFSETIPNGFIGETVFYLYTRGTSGMNLLLYPVTEYLSK
jgi:hypothetical protein